MALSGSLARAGTPPRRLETEAVVTFDKVGDAWSVTRSALTVRGDVPDMDEDAFRAAAEDAKDNCPISRALKGNVELSVDAALA
jgi:osmotically inducible protein OsmC